jgi:hypothetical protein
MKGVQLAYFLEGKKKFDPIAGFRASCDLNGANGVDPKAGSPSASRSLDRFDFSLPRRHFSLFNISAFTSGCYIRRLLYALRLGAYALGRLVVISDWLYLSELFVQCTRDAVYRLGYFCDILCNYVQSLTYI